MTVPPINVSSHISGIIAMIPQEEPTTIFVHCLAHSPNIYWQTSVKHIAPTKEALELTKELDIFINLSPKQSLFHNTQAQFFLDSHSSSIKTLCITMIDIYYSQRDEHSFKPGGFLQCSEKRSSTYSSLYMSYLLYSIIYNNFFPSIFFPLHFLSLS